MFIRQIKRGNKIYYYIAKTFREGSSVDSMEDEEEREESNQVRQGEREFHLKSFKPQ